MGMTPVLWKDYEDMDPLLCGASNLLDPSLRLSDS